MAGDKGNNAYGGRCNDRFKKHTKKKARTSDEISDLINRKMAAKQKDNIEYKQLKAEVQSQVGKDKLKQQDELCVEAEEENKKGNTRRLFQIVRILSQKFQPRLRGIQSE